LGPALLVLAAMRWAGGSDKRKERRWSRASRLDCSWLASSTLLFMSQVISTLPADQPVRRCTTCDRADAGAPAADGPVPGSNPRALREWPWSSLAWWPFAWWRLLLRTSSRRRGLTSAGRPARVDLGLNPLFFTSLVYIVRTRLTHGILPPGDMRLTLPMGLAAWLPVGERELGVERGAAGSVAQALGAALTLLAVVGLGGWRGVLAAVRPTAWADLGYRILPAPLRRGRPGLSPRRAALRPGYSYQFSKLVLSVSPVLVLGVAHAWDWLPWPTMRRVFGGASLAACWRHVVGTTGLTSPRPNNAQSSFRAVHDADEDWRGALHKLSSLKGENVVLACGLDLHNGWLAYAARHNNVWLVNLSSWRRGHHHVRGTHRVGTAAGHQVRSITATCGSAGGATDRSSGGPSEAFSVHQRSEGLPGARAGEHPCVVNAHFQLWQLGPGPTLSNLPRPHWPNSDNLVHGVALRTAIGEPEQARPASFRGGGRVCVGLRCGVPQGRWCQE